uniref:Uncharacterized protein n=1 Tax=Strigamia maritima TaxID=126957 RepID=T1JPG3_STRMM
MFNYKFSSLLGSVYRKGNVIFSNDGNVVISPVGNRITLFDLKNNTSQTLPFEGRFNLTCLALDTYGTNLIAVNEEGDASFIDLESRTVVGTHRFNKKIRAIQFSPDGRYYAVTKDNFVTVFKAPNIHGHFTIDRIIKDFYDETVCFDWTSDSRFLAVGSKSMTTRVYSIEKFINFPLCITLAGHNDSIKGCFFKKNSMDIYTVSRNGQVCIWTCSAGFDGLIQKTKAQLAQNNGKEFEIENVFYKRKARQYLGDLVRKQGRDVYLSAVDYSKEMNILVSGFSNGSFFLHEMPEVKLLYPFCIEDQLLISSISINKSGDWIALACPTLGQLVVWEWQSESYVMNQQGHVNSMRCLAYSPNGLRLATGGDDSKVKLWDTVSGLCFKTFSEHTASITGLVFSKNGKFVVSSSLDGTVRAFDFERYRNFRTFMNESKITQFSCVTMDPSCEFVCAGAQDSFEIFVWSVKNGRLLEILSGHSGPVSSLAFSPTQTVLASGSWDKTVRFWDVFENKENREIITMTSDVLAVAYRPDGKELAVATLDAQITFFEIPTLDQTGSIEGRNDLGSGRRDTDLVTPKSVLKGKAFTTICYSADGSIILAAGQSKNVCIYSCEDKVLMKKFEISQNRSFDGMDEKMGEFGNLDLVEKRDDADDDEPKTHTLPGATKGDMASRTFKPEVRVTGIIFSPTGRCWAATTTEGLLIYSLDDTYIFNPFELEVEITPVTIREKLKIHDYSTAITHALRLNEMNLIVEVVERIPEDKISFFAQSLDLKYVDRFLNFLALYLETSNNLGLCIKWISSMLVAHTVSLTSQAVSTRPTNLLLLKNLTVKYSFYRDVCDSNKYMIEYILQQGKLRRKNREQTEKTEKMEETSIDDLCLALYDFSELEKMIREVDDEQYHLVIDELKKTSCPAGISVITSLESRESAVKFLKVITAALNSNLNYNLVQSYLGLFLQIHWDAVANNIADDKEFLPVVQNLSIAQKGSWEKIQKEFRQSLCLIRLIINPLL